MQLTCYVFQSIKSQNWFSLYIILDANVYFKIFIFFDYLKRGGFVAATQHHQQVLLYNHTHVLLSSPPETILKVFIEHFCLVLLCRLALYI